ncbi:hypothetical protein FHQ23_12270, partial [Testudinibacter sp. TR-2022]
MIIYDEDNKIGIIWDAQDRDCDKCSDFCFGSINFIINDIIVPNYFVYNYTINVVFSNLKISVEEAYRSNLENEIDLPCINLSHDLI